MEPVTLCNDSYASRLRKASQRLLIPSMRTRHNADAPSAEMIGAIKIRTRSKRLTKEPRNRKPRASARVPYQSDNQCNKSNPASPGSPQMQKPRSRANSTSVQGPENDRHANKSLMKQPVNLTCLCARFRPGFSFLLSLPLDLASSDSALQFDTLQHTILQNMRHLAIQIHKAEYMYALRAGRE